MFAVSQFLEIKLLVLKHCVRETTQNTAKYNNLISRTKIGKSNCYFFLEPVSKTANYAKLTMLILIITK